MTYLKKQTTYLHIYIIYASVYIYLHIEALVVCVSFFTLRGFFQSFHLLQFKHVTLRSATTLNW